jgi:cephalosporin-C deacetylase-like acetyl esterase
MPRPLLAFAALALSLAPGAPRADDDLTVLKPAGGGPAPGKMLGAYLEKEAGRHFDARRKAVAALKTPQDIERRQADLRAKFREALGELPSEKTPLNARSVGRDRRDGYSVERVVYESRPGHHVTALFYLPEGTPPFPGVLVPCGHSANGKAAEAYQQVCILMARNGLAVLCYDPIGQGERVQLLDEGGKPTVGGGTTEHTLLGTAALLVGRSAAGYRFWDGVRSLDYLAGRPEVDPKRLGCTGNSGGGTMTAYLMALDDRVAVAAPSCFITTLERLFATIGPQDAEQNITGQVALGIEHADYLTMRAPKPTLLSVGTRDFFDIDGSWVTFREAKKLYGALGYGERVDLFESDEPHGFTKPRRESAMRWMRRWLLDKNDAPTEGDLSVATDKDVQCTETGQVMTAFPGEKSAFDLNAERARELDRRRAGRTAGRSVEALRAEVRKRLALSEKMPSMVVEDHAVVVRDGYNIDRWAFTTEPGVKVPVLLFRTREGTAGQPMTIYVGADRSLARPGGPIERWVTDGKGAVALVDPRGMGETAPGAGGTTGRGPGYVGSDVKEVFLALHLNRPLLGQRVFDVLQAMRGLLPNDEPRAFRLVGVGAGGPVVLHAAALSDRVTEVEVEGSVVSWSAVARAGVSRGQLANVVPGVLESYDLPDLAAAIAPHPLTVRKPLDPAGKPAAPGEVEAAYVACRKAYEAEKAGELFRVEP